MAIKCIGSELIVEAFTCKLGQVPEQRVDMTPYRGQTVRVFLDKKLNVQVNPVTEQFWQIAEGRISHATTEVVGEEPVQRTAEMECMITRDDGDEDEIPVSGTVVSVGNSWENFRNGIEWSASNGKITWMTQRRPETGVEYMATIEVASTEMQPIVRNIPLDLSNEHMTIYNLPE